METIIATLKQWSVEYRPYIIGFVVGAVVSAIIF